MKSKKILIVYLKQRMESIATKELMFNKIVKELTDEGKTIYKKYVNAETSTAMFEDGTRVNLVPFGQQLKGFRVTDLYIDDMILALSNGSHFVEDRLIPLVITGENYTDFEVESNVYDRVKSFTSGNKGLEIHDYK